MRGSKGFQALLARRVWGGTKWDSLSWDSVSLFWQGEDPQGKGTLLPSRAQRERGMPRTLLMRRLSDASGSCFMQAALLRQGSSRFPFSQPPPRASPCLSSLPPPPPPLRSSRDNRLKASLLGQTKRRLWALLCWSLKCVLSEIKGPPCQPQRYPWQPGLASQPPEGLGKSSEPPTSRRVSQCPDFSAFPTAAFLSREI